MAISLKFEPAKFFTVRLINHEYHYAFRVGSRAGLDLIPYAFQDFVLDVLPSQGCSEYREMEDFAMHFTILVLDMLSRL